MASTDKAAEEHGGPEKRAPLPKFPGQDALLHEAVQWREVRDDKLTELKLLDVAKGGTPSGVEEIVDVPLHMFPTVPPGHPNEYKVQMDRISAQRTNLANKAKRFRIWMTAWKRIPTHLGMHLIL